MRLTALAVGFLGVASFIPSPASAAGLATCDLLPPLATKCVAVAVFTASGCVEAAGTWAFVPLRASACASSVGAAAAASAYGLPAATMACAVQVKDVDGHQMADYGANTATLSQVSMCSAGTAAMGAECIEGGGSARAVNGLGVLVIPWGEAKGSTCGSSAISLVRNVLDKLPFSSDRGMTVSVPFSSLPPGMQESLREDMRESAIATLAEQTGAWPNDELHNALRMQLEHAVARAIADASGTVQVIYETE